VDLLRGEQRPKRRHWDLRHPQIDGPGRALANGLDQNTIRMMPGMAMLIQGGGEATPPLIAVADRTVLSVELCAGFMRLRRGRGCDGGSAGEPRSSVRPVGWHS
jgi:hypothetical protein